MARHLFESFKRPATKDEIAASVTHDTIDELEALRKDRDGEPHTPQEQELLQRLGVLMVGPRKDAVIPVIRERWPQMAALLDRKVGVVNGTTIQTLDGAAYDFLVTDDAVPEGAQVTFLPSDDGMARNIQVIT